MTFSAQRRSLILWPPGGAPIVIAVFFTQPARHADTRSDVVASAARAVVTSLI